MTDFAARIQRKLTDYKVCPEGTVELERYDATQFRLDIETGSNEGYFVTIQKGSETVAFRYHNRDEAVTALGVLLTECPNN